MTFVLRSRPMFRKGAAQEVDRDLGHGAGVISQNIGHQLLDPRTPFEPIPAIPGTVFP